MCALVLSIVAFRRKMECIINFILRGVTGMIAIYFINAVFMQQNISIGVGINLLSVLTSGVLGFPGVILLYGVQIYHFL
ncbi:MAG: Pro-sigmaK processing inhibitor BofA [Clostridiales bacterium]|nr:Pro-sigmaK processing inhibitor BofA [Clostridiales bacterium]